MNETEQALPTETRQPCPAPADFAHEVAEYDRLATQDVFQGPRHRMHYRMLGQGPPLILSPGIASTYRGYALLLNKLSERFQTIVYEYPGDQPDDAAKLRQISHEHMVDDVFGLIDHLNLGRVFLVGISFGSTITLAALHREPRRFPKAAVQGGFAFRSFSRAERLALRFGRLMPGTLANLPMREPVLTYNGKSEFPKVILDRWPLYVEENALTPIAPMAHRLDLLTHLDLRPLLEHVPNEVLILQGAEDRIVSRSLHDELCAGLPSARSVIMPLLGHQIHYTAPEAMAHTISEFFLPCAPGGCPNEPKD